MRKINFYFLSIVIAGLTVAGCGKDDNIKKDEGEQSADNEQFVIAATPLAAEGVADYLLTVDSLSGGSISLLGNGIEQDGTYRYYVTNDNKFFSLLYGQGNPGAVTAYELSEQGELVELTDFQSETVAAFTAVDDDILLMDIPRDGSRMATWYRLSTASLTFVQQGQVDVFALAGNGEQAFFTWMEQVDDYVFAPFMSMKMCCNDEWGTKFPDSAWIAVFNYPEMSLKKVIRDDRTSFIGKYFTSGIEQVENGDVYAFSSSIADDNGQYTSTKPSAVTRIKSGELAFDPTYFFNLKEASGGYYATEKTYAGDGKFVMLMRPAAEKAAYASGKRLAVVDVFNQAVTWIAGLPAASDIIHISTNNYVSEDGAVAYIGITTKQGSYVYNIDVASASATQGIEIDGGTITAISKLEVAK